MKQFTTEGIKANSKNVFSRMGEDGILEYLFDCIGTSNKYCVEFGAYNGALDSNTCNLRINHGWNGLLLDRKKKYSYENIHIKKIIKILNKTYPQEIVDIIHYFLIKKNSIKECLVQEKENFKLVKGWKKKVNKLKRVPHKRISRKIRFNVSEKHIIDILKKFYVFDVWITAENIMEIFNKHNVPEIFDFLSIDVDGNDYWIWKAIKNRPKVVIIEFNSSLGPDEDKIIPYDANFKYEYNNYFGASLKALTKLANIKGYSLVYQNAPFNAFFVLSEFVPESIKNMNIKDIFPNPVPHPKLASCPAGKKWIQDYV
ncbi:MAG: hypothetical protein WC755_02135 [Candidatus Woesearchaeota archaeon]|jgi:hypothetical protein